MDCYLVTLVGNARVFIYVLAENEWALFNELVSQGHDVGAAITRMLNMLEGRSFSKVKDVVGFVVECNLVVRDEIQGAA